MFKVILTGVFLLSCKAVVSLNENGLVLLSATRQQLYTGVKGGGVITEYNLSIKVRTNQPLHIDSAWVDKQKLPVRVLKGEAFHPTRDTQPGDTLLLVFSAHTMEPAAGTHKQTEDHPPVSYKGAALLRYYQGNKPKYLIVPEFIELEPIHAP
jgi:hypothetical protein